MPLLACNAIVGRVYSRTKKHGSQSLNTVRGLQQGSPLKWRNECSPSWRLCGGRRRRQTATAVTAGLLLVSCLAQRCGGSSARMEEECGPSAFAACARPELVEGLKGGYADLGGWPDLAGGKKPVLYHPAYNISFFGLERLHPFDSKKYQQVLAQLEREGVLRRSEVVAAAPAPREALLSVHAAAYLDLLETSSRKVAQVTELAPLASLPSWLLNRKVLLPMRYMAGGTMMAAALALQHGWAINLGGGMHHAHRGDGSGWCVYDDIYLAIRRLRAASGGRAAQRVLYIDLDTHQGNGVARDKLHYSRGASGAGKTYNAGIFPLDEYAKAGVDLRIELASGCGDAQYLGAVAEGLERAFREFPAPDLVVYNAGTDVLAGDALGRLGLSAGAVVRRDEAVWAAAAAAKSPIAMVLSGGYTPASTPCIASSIASLFRKFGL